nr:nuclear exosome regulator NRDE2 isoform X2 [Hydra vulgaris]
MSGLLFPSAAHLLTQKFDTLDEDHKNVPSYNELKILKKENEYNVCVNEENVYTEDEDMSWESGSLTENENIKAVKKKKKKSKEKKKKRKKERQKKKKDICKPDITWLENTSLTIKDAYKKDTKGSSYLKFFKQLKRKKKNKDVNIRYFKNQNKIKQVSISTENVFPQHVESKEFLPMISLNESTTDNNSTSYISAAYLEENKKFSQLLLEQPENEKAWLDFVDYQDLLFSCEEPLSSSCKVVLEKKASILEKALSYNPVSVRLILKYMNIVKQIWTSDKLYTKWKDLIFQFPNKTLIWKEYLLFTQSDLLSNKVSKVISEYNRCFRMLFGILNGTVLSHKAEENMLEGIVAIYIQLVSYLWLAGYSEKVTCMLQCIIEYNVAHPKETSNEINKLKLFEDFYNKGLPRLGESGAVHWNLEELKNNVAPIKFNDSLEELSFEISLENLKNSTTSKDKVWLHLEKVRSLLEVLPFKNDLESCEDPERIVFFEDVSFTLFTVTSSQLSFQFILTYLFILGVTIPTYMLDFLECYQSFFLVKKCSRSCLCHSKSFTNFVCIDSILFDGPKLVKSSVLLVREIFSQCMGLVSEKYVTDLSQIWLHFETMLFCFEFENTNKELDKKYWKEILKFIKNLLKLPSNRGSVMLWKMYATFEWNLGNTVDSNNIFFTAIQLTGKDKKHGIYHCAAITRNLAELLVDINKHEELHHKKQDIQKLFVAFVEPNQRLTENSEVSCVMLLKVYSILKEKLNDIIIEVNRSQLVSTSFSMIQDFLCCFILFEYLYNGPNILQKRFGEFIIFPPDMVKRLPDVFMYILVLFNNFCQSTHRHFSEYKNMISDCMQYYGSHPIFNDLFISAYRHGFNSLHARRHYEKIIKENPHDINVWINAVKYEESRLAFINCKNHSEVEFLDPSCGIQNRIRSLYGRMVQEETIMHCADVWIRFIQFQLEHGTLKQAKDVFYLSLRLCPCVKMLYLFACERLDEFNQLLELMTEKEIRVKVIMEELDVLLED